MVDTLTIQFGIVVIILAIGGLGYLMILLISDSEERILKKLDELQKKEG